MSMPALIDRIRDATDTVTDAAEGAGSTATEVTEAIGSAVGDLRDVTLRTSEDLAATLRDATSRVTDGDLIDDVVSRLERGWPGTETERYDRAFERGYARGRSGRLAVGLAVGAAAAAAGTWLLDPERGPARRAQLRARGRRVADRVQEKLASRGIRFPGATDPGPQKLLPATASPGAIGEIPSRRSALADTDMSTIETPTAAAREPVAAGTVAAEGHDAERGSWHRDLEG